MFTLIQNHRSRSPRMGVHVDPEYAIKPIYLLAIYVTGTASLIAAASGWQRGGTEFERWLLVALTVAFCAGAHFLPAISRNFVSWLLWVLCLLATMYSHVCFLTLTEQHANEQRGGQSSLSINNRGQIDTIRKALSALSSRNASVISAELTTTDDWKVRKALTDELKEARKAQIYRDELMRLQAVTNDDLISTGSNYVISGIAEATNSNEKIITTGIGFLFSFLLEIFGAFLWFVALKTPIKNNPSPSEPINPRISLFAIFKKEMQEQSSKAKRNSVACRHTPAKSYRKQFFATKSQMEIQYE